MSQEEDERRDLLEAHRLTIELLREIRDALKVPPNRFERVDAALARLDPTAHLIIRREGYDINDRGVKVGDILSEIRTALQVERGTR